ncbi:MAG: hypothetical protein V7727_13765 [Sneathiella sp.]
MDYHGNVTGNDIYDVVHAIFTDNRFSSLEFWLSDRTEVTNFDVSTEVTVAIGKMSATYLEQNPNLIIALVSPTDIEFAMSRMMELQANSPNPFLVCRCRAEAEEWIVKERQGEEMPA